MKYCPVCGNDDVLMWKERFHYACDHCGLEYAINILETKHKTYYIYCYNRNDSKTSLIKEFKENIDISEVEEWLRQYMNDWLLQKEISGWDTEKIVLENKWDLAMGNQFYWDGYTWYISLEEEI